MTLHMLVEWPLLAISGASARRSMSTRRFDRAAAALDPLGLLGVTVMSCVSMFWMIPSALDASLVYSGMGAFKFASWWIAGFVFASSLARTSEQLLLALSSSSALTMLIAGLFYVLSPSRLCVDYLIDDQRDAGTSLVLLAVAMGALVLWRNVRPSIGVHAGGARNAAAQLLRTREELSDLCAARPTLTWPRRS
jgi:hypothetical protein